MKDQRLRWLASPLWSFASTVLFALYNGALGLLYANPWHGSICVYYLLLSLLRGLLLSAEHRAKGKERALVPCAFVLVLMNLALVAPVSLMVLDQRSVRMGMIPAIAAATYTTYKIVAAAVKLKRPAATVYLRGLALLRFVDALVSILVLQNTLLCAVDGGVSLEMLPLAAISSGGILLVIFVLSLLWLIRAIQKTRGPKITP